MTTAQKEAAKNAATLNQQASAANFWEERWSAAAKRMTSSAIRELLKLTQQPDIISFGGGLPAPELFPVQEVREATEKVLSQYGPRALQYSTTEGHLPLRQALAEQAGITPEHVQITTGSQQSLDLLGKMLIDQGDTVLVEAPTYLGALQSFVPYGPKYLQIPTDDDGINVDALRELLDRHSGPAPKFLYAIPNFQNPSGRTLAGERRRALLELTHERGIIVIEDDPYGKLRFSGEHLPNLYELGQEAYGTENNHVVYCSSFSKTLMPGLRDAWVQASLPLIARLVQAKQGADLHTPTLNQMLVTELLPLLPRQVEKVSAVYRERAGIMTRAMRQHFPGEVHHTEPEGGMFLWVTTPESIDTTQLLARAVERKVAFVPGAPFFALGGGHNTMRLSYSSSTPEQIERGIKALGELLHEEMR